MKNRNQHNEKSALEGYNDDLEDSIQAKHIWSVVIVIYAILFIVIGCLEYQDKTIYKAFNKTEKPIVEHTEDGSPHYDEASH